MRKAIETLQKIQVAAGASFLLIFLVTTVVQIVTRYLEIPSTWTEDVCMYSFIWMVFMGASAMVYEKKHFAFTSLSDMLKNEKVKNALSIVIWTIMLGFSLLMIYYGCVIAEKFWDYTWVNIPALKRGPTWLCVPIAGVTSSIYLIDLIMTDVKNAMKGGNRS